MTNNSNDSAQKQDNSGFAGTLRNIQITDIIQMCCLAGASLSIRVTQDNNQGTIFIEDGEIVHAECGDVKGIDAFFTILGWPSGQFETMEAPPTEEPTIKEACQFLLMEAARQSDETATDEGDCESEADEELCFESQDKIQVLIVDDSPIMSKILSSMMTADPDIDVVGTAKNGEEALKKIKSLKPDLITMDVNMPVMDGSTALKHIMISSPCPVLIMSNLLPSSYNTLLSFLNLGAVDFMSKPVKSSNIVLQQQRMVERVHKAAKADMRRFHLLRRPKISPDEFIHIEEDASCEKLLIVNSGAGGYLEMVNLVTTLPNLAATGVISFQSVPPPFAPTLCSFLNARSRYEVQPLKGNATIKAGGCYIGACGKDFQFNMNEGKLVFQAGNDEKNDGTPAGLDRILMSAAELYQDRVMVVLLSGSNIGTMEGLRAVQSAGGKIIAPEPEKSILPDSFLPAIDEGLITEVFDNSKLAEVLVRQCT